MTPQKTDPQRGTPSDQSSDSGRPETGSGEGRKDVTGIMPEGIRVDPDITEGHPGYEESGDSEIIPPGRPAPQETPQGKG
jgi:hypothetical protein